MKSATGVVILCIMVPVMAVFIALAYKSGSAQPAYPPACGNEETQERVRTLMLQGVDTAFSEQVAALYSVWVRDETGQPHRAKVGTDQAISAYVRARRSADEWKLVPC